MEDADDDMSVTDDEDAVRLSSNSSSSEQGYSLRFVMQTEHEHLFDWYLEGRGDRPDAFRFIRLSVSVLLVSPPISFCDS